jgi:hypothetical protein
LFNRHALKPHMELVKNLRARGCWRYDFLVGP